MFEVFVAIIEKVKVEVRLASTDMTEFRRAVLKDGIGIVETAMAKLDAREATASVPSDRDMIMSDIDACVGFEEFNRRVRECMLGEFKRVALEAMR